MKKYYGLIKFVLMSLCYEMAIYLIAVKVGIDEYAAKYRRTSNSTGHSFISFRWMSLLCYRIVNNPFCTVR